MGSLESFSVPSSPSWEPTFGNWIELPPMGGHAGEFIGAMFVSEYLMIVKSLEVVGGVLLLSGRFAPLGLATLLPVIVNIDLFDILLVQKFNPAGAVVTVLALYLLLAYRQNFAPLFAPPLSSQTSISRKKTI